jgi:sugar O-acyltransferase (sialic acid O-acetyltransferase NeuD family)
MKALIYGSGAQGRVTLDALRATDRHAEIEFVDDNPAKWGTSVDGVWIGGGFEEVARAGGEERAIIAALGDPVKRLALTMKAKERGLRLLNVVHPSAVVSASAVLGEGSFVAAHATVCAGAHLGAAVIVNTGAVVEHDSVVEDGAQVAPGALLGARVTVERGAFVCMRATVLPRVRIGAFSVVAASALVTRDVPSGALVAGAPARVRERAGEDFSWSRLL